jgi:hypothetical protein
MEPPSEIDLAKMAAVIDCEGHIAINYTPSNRHYALHVTVGNTNFRLLEWCQERFGGAIYEIFPKKKRGPEYAHAKRWRIQNAPAAELLIKCLPHFIMKRPQAEIAIRFQRTKPIPGARSSESDRVLREEFRQQLRGLTRRGPRPTAKEITTEPSKKRDQADLFSSKLDDPKGQA